jgi:tripartite-type tricarboxylate transporter receptor subunit TctC
MHLPRILLMPLATGLTLLVSSNLVGAQQYPSRPITLIVPYPAGGLSDIAARAAAQEMSKQMKASFVVENRVGASGTVGASYVARSAPDGYTLLVTAPADVTNLHFMTLPYDILSDFTHIGMIVEGPPLILIVTPSLPYKSVKDLVDDARANPGKLSFGSSGPASGPSIAIAQFQSMAHIKIVDVPYRGVAQAALGVVGGEIPAAFTYQNSAKPLADDGKVRALASTGSKRSPSWPQLPTMIEAGFEGYQFDAFVGLSAPAKTPPDVVAALNRALNAAIAEPAFRGAFAGYGMAPRERNSPKDFTDYMNHEIARIGELAKLTKK